jgi:biotin-(acetyl-CoA carboxylase) ligase
MDFELPHAHASNAADELKALQSTDFWLELPADVQIALSKAHGILVGLTGAMEAAGHV